MDFLKNLGIESINPGACSGPGQWASIEGRELKASVNPANGEPIAKIAQATADDYEAVMSEELQDYIKKSGVQLIGYQALKDLMSSKIA